MQALILYTTSHCHLCEQAEAMLNIIASSDGIHWCSIEIVDNELLLAAYATKIPVIKAANSGHEISWPFSISEILALTNN